MKRYLVERLLLLVPTLLGAVTLVFFFIHLIPGDPIEVMLGETASVTDKEELRHALALDEPIALQYTNFLAGLARGNLGHSLYEQGDVAEIIGAHLPATIELTFGAFLLAVLASFPLAVLASRKKHGWIDRICLLFSFLGLSLPNFCLGPLLMIIFAIHLGWFPVSGRGGFSHLLLPALTLGLGMAAILTRILRATLLQVAGEEYVQTARAKGLGETRVWLKHTLRNALLPVITILSLQLGGLLAGSIITETIFSWPGIGRLTIQAIQSRDYPLVQGCVLTLAVSYVLVNFIGDICYRFADPRINYEK